MVDPIPDTRNLKRFTQSLAPNAEWSTIDSSDEWEFFFQQAAAP